MSKSRIFYMANMPFNTIRENKILTKISLFIVTREKDNQQLSVNKLQHMYM